MNAIQVQALARQLLTLAGGYMVGAGYLDAAQSETLVGALAALAGVTWSLWASRKVGVVTAASKISEVHEIVMAPESTIPDKVAGSKVTNG